MVFNSFHLLIFLPLVTILFYLLPSRFRWMLLLVASFYFYMVWEPIYILLIIFSILVDFYTGVKMGNLATKQERKPYMALSIICNLGNLTLFKYLDFFTSSINQLFQSLNMEYMLPLAHLILPLGISFYSFQAMSYTLDVYKGKSAPERHLGIFALYITFFPQLVAGPIERAKHLIDQFHFNYKFNWNNITSGLRLIMMGLFKKVVIADQLSSMVSHVFNNASEAHGITVYIGCMLFAYQVYCDFSGYSDIARGSARLLGVDLMENFKLPFFANSYSNFWSQWHISLMNWFRDYIMFPLVKMKWKWPAVFLLVFFISGLWHGANWTFVAWGIYNGLLVIYTKSTLKFRSKLLDKAGFAKFTGMRHVVQSICVVHFFAFSAVFFRANNLSDSWILIQNLFTDFVPVLKQIASNANNVRQDLLYVGKDAVTFYMVISFLVILEIFQWNIRKITIDEAVNKLHPFLRYLLYTSIVMAILLMSNVAEVPFIYFQF
ncbi:MAG: MBOAT family protein [Bacteroidetes bacterium]|nr:MBOAT family protein [Bacteroidota bacterium]